MLKSQEEKEVDIPNLTVGISGLVSKIWGPKEKEGQANLLLEKHVKRLLSPKNNYSSCKQI